MTVRGIRGATTVAANDAEEILAAARELLERLVAANGLDPADLASAIFTATADLDAVYPARAARDLGWTQVPLLCMQELAVAGSLSRCIRVLLHWNTALDPQAIHHVYLHGAATLRPDLISEEEAL